MLSAAAKATYDKFSAICFAIVLSTSSQVIGLGMCAVLVLPQLTYAQTANDNLPVITPETSITISITSPAQNALITKGTIVPISGQISITGTLLASSSLEITDSSGAMVFQQSKDGSNTNVAYSWDTSTLPDGIYSIVLKATDGADVSGFSVPTRVSVASIKQGSPSGGTSATPPQASSSPAPDPSGFAATPFNSNKPAEQSPETPAHNETLKPANQNDNPEQVQSASTTQPSGKTKISDTSSSYGWWALLLVFSSIAAYYGYRNWTHRDHH